MVPFHAESASRSRRIGVAKGKFSVPDDIDRFNPEVVDLFQAG